MKESQHWYDITGKSCHTQPYADKKRAGESRSTNLTDARRLGLFPSVTGILGVLDKPQLTDWKLSQLSKEWRSRLMKITTRANSGPNDVTFAIADMLERDPSELHEEILDHALAQVEQAADAGEIIHKGAELALQGLEYDHDQPVYLPELDATFPLSTFIKPVQEFVKLHQIQPLGHEVRIVDPLRGYAGTGDLPFLIPVQGNGFLDFKTRKTKPGIPVKAYDTQILQIAAYIYGYDWSKHDMTCEPAIGCNLYISTTEPGRIEAVWYDNDQLEEADIAFTGLCWVWQFMKKYTPPNGQILSN